MPAKASSKREREFRQLEQRSQFGETVADQQKYKAGQLVDRVLSLHGYRHLTTEQIVRQLASLPASGLRKIRAHEVRHQNRRGVLDKIDRLLSAS